MTAIVYSGSRFAYWKITDGKKLIAECRTPGINPCFADKKATLQVLNKESVLVNYAEDIRKIYFFAAGASSADRQRELSANLKTFFRGSRIFVESDIHGAAIAACGEEPGIICTLGSGSNCAYFDGKKTRKNNFGLGFVLGDEGSSNNLGIMLVRDLIGGKLPKDLQSRMDHEFKLDRTLILEKVYRKPNPQVFLSSFLDFYIRNREHEYIRQNLAKSFSRYFETYLAPMAAKYAQTDIHFVGIVAGNFGAELQNVADGFGIRIKSITKEPIYNLLKFYTN
ncbi:hypothetical protein C7T94_15635 [Pedobacter yulinensis]|uniref:N-acetylglucosamine kinase n=1 Tax=Pedobacter yulinensis TaxID=2126353 RepID=A0A2T3HIG3_9SPHI|nr:hypothetical protein [Pedobacter yulinensis]PST82227.1 hypothetical protein C7T94_15635 [Pedobacter yulinensis]